MKAPPASTTNHFCPSCGRDIGPERERCIYCGAQTVRRATLFRIQICSLPLIVAAAIYLFLALCSKPVYQPIAPLDQSKNFQRVRIRGEVRAVRLYPGKYKSHLSIALTIKDRSSPASAGSNTAAKNHRSTIRVKAEGEIATSLKDRGLIPDVGDIVDVSATLYAGADYRVLSLGGPQFIRIIGKTKSKPQYVEATVAKLLERPEKFKGKKVTIKKARIARCRGSYQIDVTDPAGNDSLAVFGVDPSNYEPGDLVSVRGTFGYYEKRRCWQVRAAFGDYGAVRPYRRSLK